MTGRELSEKLNYTGMENAIRKLAIKDKMAPIEKIAAMSELEVCELIAKEYELVFEESECVGLVRKDKSKELFKMLEFISR